MFAFGEEGELVRKGNEGTFQFQGDKNILYLEYCLYRNIHLSKLVELAT